jgi:6-phosphogluconolactonase/glucosamine-6-phosphate isomerase/deaminase
MAEEVENYAKYLSTIYSNTDARLISIMGVGSDFHTGGIKPNDDENIFKERFLSDKFVCGYEAEDFTRVTQTLTSIKKHDSFFVYMRGEQKSNALSKIIDQSSPLQLNRYPLQIYRKVNKTVIYTDIM